MSPNDELFAVSNYDPFSKAFVISRGIVGSNADVVKVASPIYKNAFCLRTGKSLDDDKVQLRHLSGSRGRWEGPGCRQA